MPPLEVRPAHLFSASPSSFTLPALLFLYERIHGAADSHATFSPVLLLIASFLISFILPSLIYVPLYETIYGRE